VETRNVTITLDDETARWARIEAARRDTSVSRLIRDLLRTYMASERSYERAMEEYLADRPSGAISRPGTVYPRREELHDRAGLR
jgi:plasmid stability protein